jgi:hypothetical protein
MMKQTILFLAANPVDTDRLALDREARAIHEELQRSGYRDCFDLQTWWATEPLDLLRKLRELRPRVVHFSGHGGHRHAPLPGRGEQAPGGHGSSSAHRNIAPMAGPPGGAAAGAAGEPGLYFQDPSGRAQFVTAQALGATFGAAGASVKLIVLNACYSDAQADALIEHVDCVVGMGGAIADDAARNFAIGFYGGLGARESVDAAVRQGRAAISLEGLRDSDRPKLKVRAGVDAGKFVVADRG